MMRVPFRCSASGPGARPGGDLVRRAVGSPAHPGLETIETRYHLGFSVPGWSPPRSGGDTPDAWSVRAGTGGAANATRRGSYAALSERLSAPPARLVGLWGAPGAPVTAGHRARARVGRGSRRPAGRVWASRSRRRRLCLTQPTRADPRRLPSQVGPT
jgi:hypothetical protein